MLLFDYIFYATLLISLLLVYWIIAKSKSSPKKTVKLLKGLGVLFGILMWVWQIGLWSIPKGSKWHEVVRLPRHLSTLSAIQVPSIESKKLLYGQHQKQYVDYYQAPANGKNADKIIFYLHGGGWHTGSPKQHLTLAKLLLEQGYNVAMPAYRLGPTYGYEAIRQDVDAAFLSTLKQAATHGLTKPTLIIGGTSAGGNLAGLLAYDDNRWDQLGVDRKQLKGVFSIVGVLDLSQMEKTQVLNNYAGATTDPIFDAANPMNYVTLSDDFPLLCLHGTKDGLVPYAGIQAFTQKVKQTTASNVKLVDFPNHTHIEIGAAWYYDDQKNYGQDSILIDWLQQL